MSDTDRTIWCIVEGDKDPFKASISLGKRIYHLQEVIYTKINKGPFLDVNAKDGACAPAHERSVAQGDVRWWKYQYMSLPLCRSRSFLVLEHRASVDEKDATGRTAFDVAGTGEKKKLLSEYGARNT